MAGRVGKIGRHTGNGPGTRRRCGNHNRSSEWIKPSRKSVGSHKQASDKQILTYFAMSLIASVRYGKTSRSLRNGKQLRGP
jgi:hypothetical protein